MTAALFALVEGKSDWADIFFLAAFIVFVIVAVLHGVERTTATFLLAVGLALVSLAWLVL